MGFLESYIYIIGAVGAWFLAQGIKVLIVLKHNYEDNISWQRLVASGGMPSAHVSLVTTMAILVGLGEGFETALFGLTVTLWGVVIYDAMGVRRITGENTQIIRQIANQLKIGGQRKALYLALGHTPYQVVGGLVVGILWGVFVHWLLGV